MKRKMVRKQNEAQEEKKEALLPTPELGQNQQREMEVTPVEPKEVLLMRIVTWLRDSHALFDYESRQIHKKNLKIDNSCKFLRNKDDVKTVGINHKVDEDPDTKTLFSLIKEEDGSYFIDTEKKNNTDKLWLVVRAMKNDTRKLSYELKKSDIIKLGRIQFRVKDIQTPTITKNNPYDVETNEDIEEVRSIITQSQEEAATDENSNAPQCRFCWLQECSEDNPLINVCVCTGTMKYIHLSWLKRWVKSKVKPITNEKMKDWLESYIWKTFECEVCKTKYPYTLKNGEIFYNIFDIEIPDGPFCILESLSIDKNSSRMIFIMKPNKPQMEFKVGRGHDSDIRVSDISVSRYHARIKYQDGQFLLEDNTSKFGTLVMIKDKTPIIANHTCAVQSGRTVVTYMLKSVEFLRQTQAQWRNPAMLSVPDSQQIRKLNEYKQEEQNLNRLVQNKADSAPHDRSNMRMNQGASNLMIQARSANTFPSQMNLGNFYLRESNNYEVPPVPEGILGQEMEEEQENSNNNEEDEEC